MTSSIPAFPEGVFKSGPTTALHIDPVQLLQKLQNDVMILDERIATPGLDHSKTEYLRGIRTMTKVLLTQIAQEIENETDKK